MDRKAQETRELAPRVGGSGLTYQGVKDSSNGAGHHHAQDGFGPVSLAVHEHQPHILEVTHGTREELHEGVRQPVAGQHFHCIFLDCGDASVQGLWRGKDRPQTALEMSSISRDSRLRDKSSADRFL